MSNFHFPTILQCITVDYMLTILSDQRLTIQPYKRYYPDCPSELKNNSLIINQEMLAIMFVKHYICKA